MWLILFISKCLVTFCVRLQNEAIETLVPAKFAAAVPRDPTNTYFTYVICIFLYQQRGLFTSKCCFDYVFFCFFFCGGERLCTVQYEMYLRGREMSMYLLYLALSEGILCCWTRILTVQSVASVCRLQVHLVSDDWRMKSLSCNRLRQRESSLSYLLTSLHIVHLTPHCFSQLLCLRQKRFKGQIFFTLKSSVFWKSQCTSF
jgi:hypothetical protein